MKIRKKNKQSKKERQELKRKQISTFENNAKGERKTAALRKKAHTKEMKYKIQKRNEKKYFKICFF